jgi:predicted dehydrogenase
MPLNCAVVGLGWWGRRVIEELADSEVIAVVTAVDPSADARA